MYLYVCVSMCTHNIDMDTDIDRYILLGARHGGNIEIVCIYIYLYVSMYLYMYLSVCVSMCTHNIDMDKDIDRYTLLGARHGTRCGEYAERRTKYDIIFRFSL